MGSGGEGKGKEMDDHPFQILEYANVGDKVPVQNNAI